MSPHLLLDNTNPHPKMSCTTSSSSLNALVHAAKSMDKESQVSRSKTSGHASERWVRTKTSHLIISVHLNHRLSAVCIFFLFMFVLFLRLCPLNSNEAGRGLGKTWEVVLTLDFHLLWCSTPHLCFQHKAWSMTWLQSEKKHSENKENNEISGLNFTSKTDPHLA